MKIRKTRQEQRTEYRYPVQVEDGKGGYRVVYNTIRPGDGEGEDIVTELHIQTMHSLDDSEVYYNTKNMRPQRSDSMKAEIAEWKSILQTLWTSMAMSHTLLMWKKN